jgi:hypothetical protein
MTARARIVTALWCATCVAAAAVGVLLEGLDRR